MITISRIIPTIKSCCSGKSFCGIVEYGGGVVELGGGEVEVGGGVEVWGGVVEVGGGLVVCVVGPVGL